MDALQPHVTNAASNAASPARGSQACGNNQNCECKAGSGSSGSQCATNTTTIPTQEEKEFEAWDVEEVPREVPYYEVQEETAEVLATRNWLEGDYP